MNWKLAIFPLAIILFALAQPIQAHFPWLLVDENGKAALFFGESLGNRNYKLPASLQQAEVRSLSPQAEKLLALHQVESEYFIGMVSKAQVDQECLLSTEITYGVYHGSKLNYVAQHIHGSLPERRSSRPSSKQGGSVLGAELIRTSAGVDVFVSFDGKPLADVEIHLSDANGSEQATAKTDKNGKASFSSLNIVRGINGLMLGHTIAGEKGNLKGEEYTSTMYYYTCSFESENGPNTSTVDYEDLPFAITSFGAARIGNRAFVYGGHTGNPHEYSTEAQSDKLIALNLMEPAAKWKTISTGKRLQGLAMVPYKTSLVVVGGFTAMNEKGQDHQLNSQASVRAFDTKTNSWSELPNLPESRSSHDAAILGSMIYVVGGWTLAGDMETQWHDTAWCMDISKENPTWRAIAQPPFQRRALAIVAHEDQLFAIGGMDVDDGPTRNVSIYNPQSDTWRSGPELPGDSEMAGFGASGWSIDGKLIVTTYGGDVLRLAENQGSWGLIGNSIDSRFFHRLVPLDNGNLLSVGGANMESGKFLKLEVLSVGK